MTMTTSRLFRFIALFVFSLLLSNSHSWNFTITNNCPHTIWPATLAGAGTPQLPTTGFRLESGLSVKIAASPGWSGRIWARTGCMFDDKGVGACQTGDCGGRMECNGFGSVPPTTLFEITLGKGDDKDFYDVSLVDGYNLPIVASPSGGYGGCNVTGCVANLNSGCPKELQVVNTAIASTNVDHVVACKSACDAFGLDEYCCSGEHANPNTCRPSYYSIIFKQACPRAYSYAFDDGTSIFTCKALEYTITFCPQINGLSRSNSSSTLIPPIYGQSNGGAGKIVPSYYGNGESVETNSSNILSLHISFLLIFILSLLAHVHVSVASEDGI